MQIFVNDKLVANLNNKKGVWLVYNDEIQCCQAAKIWTLKAKEFNFEEEFGVRVELKKEDIVNILNHFSDKLKLEKTKSKFLIIAENENEKKVLENSQYLFDLEPNSKCVIIHQDLDAIEKS